MELELATFDDIAEEIARRYTNFVMAGAREGHEPGYTTFSCRFGGKDHLRTLGLANRLRRDIEDQVEDETEPEDNP